MLHFVDNLSVSSEEKKKKLWKPRPFLILNSLRSNFLQLIPKEHCCIDKVMCQYRGKTSPIRQYIKGNPTFGVLKYGHELIFIVYCMISMSIKVVMALRLNLVKEQMWY